MREVVHSWNLACFAYPAGAIWGLKAAGFYLIDFSSLGIVLGFGVFKFSLQKALLAEPFIHTSFNHQAVIQQTWTFGCGVVLLVFPSKKQRPYHNLIVDLYGFLLIWYRHPGNLGQPTHIKPISGRRSSPPYFPQKPYHSHLQTREVLKLWTNSPIASFGMRNASPTPHPKVTIASRRGEREEAKWEGSCRSCRSMPFYGFAVVCWL